jgi:hypothetical protein
MISRFTCQSCAMSGWEAQRRAASAGATGTVCRVGFGHCGGWAENIRPNLDARYAPSFVDLAEAHLEDFDAVIPMQIEHYGPLARHPELRGHKFFHPSPEVVGLCHDKLTLTRFLIAEGFSSFVPRLRSSGAPYPYVWKRRRGFWGAHCRRTSSAATEALPPPRSRRPLLERPTWRARGPQRTARLRAT